MVLGSGIRYPGSGKNPFRIPDPGVKKAPDPGSRIRIRNTVYFTVYNIPFAGLGSGQRIKLKFIGLSNAIPIILTC
jgi:hypothetical protein